MKSPASLLLSTLFCVLPTTDAFVVARPTATAPPSAAVPTTALGASIAPPEYDDRQFLLSKEDINAVIRLGQGEKEKVVNAFGLWCAAVSVFTGPIWMAAMSVVDTINSTVEEWDPNRAIFDTTGKIWAKVWLTMTNSFPTVSGEPLHDTGRPCLYVANHASWLDIPVLCTVLDPVFKFIAKGELERVPCIGKQLHGVSVLLPCIGSA